MRRAWRGPGGAGRARRGGGGGRLPREQLDFAQGLTELAELGGSGGLQRRPMVGLLSQPIGRRESAHGPACMWHGRAGRRGAKARGRGGTVFAGFWRCSARRTAVGAHSLVGLLPARPPRATDANQRAAYKRHHSRTASAKLACSLCGPVPCCSNRPRPIGRAEHGADHMLHLAWRTWHGARGMHSSERCMCCRRSDVPRVVPVPSRTRRSSSTGVKLDVLSDDGDLSRSPVPVQMWDGCAQSRCRSGSGGRKARGAYVSMAVV